MAKLNQLLNTKFNIINVFSILLFALLPISILIGNAAINFNILLIDFLFLIYCFKHKNWSWLKSQTFSHLSIIYLFLISNSVYSYFFLVENEIGGLYRSILFIKFLLLVFAFSSLLKDDKIIDTVVKFWLIISVIVIFDIFYEKYFGRNILGYVSPNGFRIISFFKDEMVVGGYILCFGFTSITFFLNKDFNRSNLIIFLIIFLLVPIAVFTTGERSNFIKSFFLFLIIIFFLKEKKFNVSLKYLFITFVISIFCFIYFSENTKQRYAVFFKRIIVVEKSENIFNRFENIKYFAHFDTAIKILKNYPLTGIGNKNFRKECSKEIYFDEKIKYSSQRCSTHPHQIHFEILSEQGLIGYFLIIYFLIIFLIKNLKVYQKKRNIDHLSNISYTALFFVPLLPGAGIFSTFNGSLFWIIFSLTYLKYKKLNS